MFNRDQIISADDQMSKLLDFFRDNETLNRMDCITAIYGLKNQSRHGPKFTEIAIREALNFALQLITTDRSCHHIYIDEQQRISVGFKDRSTDQDRINSDAFDTLLNRALAEPDGFHWHVIEWFKRNDYAGFRSALSGCPREEFENLVA
ncbi:hypothetical protein [Mesorhizobium sp. SP-1A]|uniref:hypothetical protein n=1 Tax=Mesorhizobium sp. SP-1A TaxID=3077840 RepID=UPI0028F6E0E1|nr:hypothetical protein [Mesorhizobium sp. SP-1A]